MHLQFCGAAGEVTGSCTKVDAENATLLIDCGLFQGTRFAEEENYHAFPFKPDAIDAVLVTHAHLDHCGRLPKLVNQGFGGKIYSTEATRDLVALILLDAAGILGEEAERHGHPPLYTEEDVVATMERFTCLPYDKEFQVATGVSATFFNAGHVLGSSFIEVKGEGKSLIFSGDMGNYPVPLLKKAEDPPAVDALILETTYGDKTHGDYNEGRVILEQAIRDTVRDKGVLLIPAFALERTQELLTMIDEAVADKNIPDINAYLDSPLGIKISMVYEKHKTELNKTPPVKSAGQGSDHPVFDLPHLTPTVTVEQSKMINEVDPPKLIIAGSGMMQGGRILHHLKHYLPLASTRLLIVGHQVEGSIGRNLLAGERSVMIHGQKIDVNATVLGTHSFSSHMDQEQLIDWVKNMPKPPKLVFLNHGDPDARQTFSDLLTKEVDTKTFSPAFGEGFTLE